jgi:pimeloyl-ACP methyl ester carboxylesterase
VAVTACSEGLNLATSRKGVPATELSSGPFIRVDGVLTRYQRWGDRGSPIVLVHGFVESTYAWSTVAPLMARSHVVYALDLRGFGYSQRLGPYTLAGYTDQLQAFIAALHIHKPLLVGHSLGAAVVAELALRQPKQVAGMVLADGDARAGGAGPGALRSLIVDPFATSIIRIIIRSDAVMREILKSAYGPAHPPLTEALVNTWRGPFRVSGSESALKQMAEHGVPGLTDAQLSQVKVPSILVWGAKDSNVPLSAGRAAAADLGGAPLTILPRAGHLSMLIDPVAFAKAVDGFAARLALTR